MLYFSSLLKRNIMKPLYTFWLFINLMILISCTATTGILELICKLPKGIKESSAVEVTEKSDLIWTLEDSGNNPELYAIDKKGTLVNTLVITNKNNTDWEDLTSDKQGNLYIGDFGNNKNERKDLAIYKVNVQDLTKTNAEASQTINFYYPEQKEFPPKKSKRTFDVESFFFYNNNFYLFTKNRSSKFDGTTSLYKVPNQSGNHPAELIGSFKTGGDFRHNAITSTDMSPDGKKVVLLSSSKIWVFTDFKNDNFLSGKVHETALGDYSQKEGICFVGNDKLLITDEKDKSTGGNLYSVAVSKLK